MKKLTLDIDALAVQSFQTGEQKHPDRGTVMGQARPTSQQCVYPTAVNHSCEPGVTDNEFSCFCLYPDTDARMCCSNQGCSLAKTCMA